MIVCARLAVCLEANLTTAGGEEMLPPIRHVQVGAAALPRPEAQTSTLFFEDSPILNQKQHITQMRRKLILCQCLCPYANKLENAEI